MIKHKKKNSRKSKFKLTTSGIVVLYLSLGIMFGLFLARTNLTLWRQLPLAGNTDAYNHLSNLAFSYLILINFGLAVFYQSIAWNLVFWAAIFLIILNLVVETSVTFLNTKDPTDAIFGIFGVILGLLFLYIIQKYCLKLNNPKP
jgi:hypothetical protein